MLTLLLWLALAVVVAVVTLVIAGFGSAEGGVRSVVADLRSALAARFSRTDDDEMMLALDAEPVDVSLDAFLAAAQIDDEAYVQAEGMQSTIEFAADKVASAAGAITRR